MTRQLFDRLAIIGIACFAVSFPLPSSAQLTLANKPLYITAPIPPSVMLDISKDQQLYKKAYNDYSDLDGDGQVETTYKNTIDYYGYFDTAKCYTYSSASQRFEPSALATSSSSLPVFWKFNTDIQRFYQVTMQYYYNSDLKKYVLADPNLPPTAYYNAATGTSTAWVAQTPSSGDLPKHYCNGSSWSGNFLNWVSMARVDAVRKLLYGGLRSTDQTYSSGGATALTVLERSYLPNDAHSWAKYYNGSDINSLTPFNPNLGVSDVASTSTVSIGTGAKTFVVGSSTTSFAVGDQIMARDAGNQFGNYMIGAVSCVNGTGIAMYNSLAANANTCNANEVKIVVESGGAFGSGNISNWLLRNWTQTGVTFCNTTLGGGSPNDKSQTNTNPPLIRAVSGNFSLWAANERWQCRTREDLIAANLEKTDALAGATGTQGNRASQSGSFASSIGPNMSTSSSGRINNGSGYGDFVARVKSCDPNWLGDEKCKQYPAGNYKPIGLLQVYGEPGLLKFGLMTGSYDKNISGGVLRKNIGPLTDEINALGGGSDSGDGTFKVPSGGNIINTLSRMRIYGYYYGDGTYLGSNGDNCTWQQVSVSQGQCRSWGNPMAEIFYETIRYFSGHGNGATSAYTYGSGSADATLGLPLATWSDPLTNNNYCSPLNALVFNASVSTNEYNKSSPAPSSTQNTSKFDLGTHDLADINGSGITPASKTNAVGDGEGITGNSYFIGKTLSGSSYSPASTSSNYELCTAKTVSGLGQIYGICPEGPTLEGSYLMSGLAYLAHTNRIRTDLTAVPTTDAKSLKVATYGVQLATNVPRLTIPVPGSTSGQAIVIQPAYRLDTSGRTDLSVNQRGMGGGALVDMQLVYRSYSSTTATGQVYLNWEDSEQGGDYDQDVWGILRYCITTTSGGCDAAMGLSGTLANSVYVMTNTVAYSTIIPQGFGYIISGTTQDGPHFHSGILNFKFADPQSITIVKPATPSSAHLGTDGGCGTDSTKTWSATYRDVNNVDHYADGNGCDVTDPVTIARYAIGTASSSNSLQDSLYYASKWGGFKDTDGDNKPNLQAEWDSKKSDGTAGADGNPDTYFLVSNPLALEQALNTAFVFIVNASSAASVATNSTSLNTNTVVYQARFNPANWGGELLAYRLNSDATLDPTPLWDAGITSTPNETRLDQISRTILTMKPSTQGGSAFQWSAIDSSQQNYLEKIAVGATPTAAQTAYGQALLNYLRGSGTDEGTGGLQFRARVTTKLGDIVNSSPLYVGAPQGQYEDPNLLLQAYTSSDSYISWRASSIKSRSPMIYVGANDGMLHGFEAATGIEKLAYVPSTVYPNLPVLVSPTYNDPSSSEHTYFVDGSPAIADAEFSTGWKTVLAGGLGKGGRAIYALDVSNPALFSESKTDTVLWEFSNTSVTRTGSTINADAGEIGYVYGKPMIAKMNNGKWAVVFGNGYNSNSNTASLFIIFIEAGVGGNWVSGTNYLRIPTNTGSAGTPNGLSAVNAIDTNGDGTIDYIYAGDLLGNLWKFDVSSSDATSWAVANVAGAQRPLFVACTGPASGLSTANSCPSPYIRQPITTRPELSFSPPNVNDVIVYFGTGQYLTSADPTNTTTQTMYGIRDTNTTGGTTVRPDRGVLQPQTIVDSSVTGFRTFQTTSGGTTTQDASYPVDWTSKYGWYEDLPISGERVVGLPKLVRGTLFYNTFIPTTNPCDFGGTGYLMAVDYATGGMPKTVIFVTNTTFVNSVMTSGIKVGAGLGGSIVITPSSLSSPGAVLTSTTQGGLSSQAINPSALKGTRISWRELLP